MSDTKLVPANATFAAKRGFIRTTAQSIATALGAGITVALVSDAVDKASAGDWGPLVISAAVTILTPFVNGAQSYFDILSRGIPADYRPELPPQVVG
jgi:hypothetical protein